MSTRFWLLAIALAGCDSGFSIGVTVDRGCLAVPSKVIVNVVADPGEQRSDASLDGPAFFAGAHRIVVIPPDGAAQIRIGVDARDQAGDTLASAGDTIAISGHALIERTLVLTGACGDGGPDARPDGAVDGGHDASVDAAPDLAGDMTAPRCKTNMDCLFGAMPLCCNGACLDGATDPANCGACGSVCALPNASAKCVASMCAVDQCAPGWGHCDNSPGCLTNLSTDVANCGACGKACLGVANAATIVCANATCTIGTCAPPWADCDKQFADGCEVDTSSDGQNCGACGVKCANNVCGGSACALRAFVTSGLAQGNLGGLAGADMICQQHANAANLGGTWQAWLSSATTSAKDRFKTQSAGPYVRLDGKRIADSFTVLIGNGVAVPIALNEKGMPGTNASASCNAVSQLAWSATTVGGVYDGSGDCGAWTLNGVAPTGVGDFNATGPGWTEYCSATCAAFAPLYCFEQ